MDGLGAILLKLFNMSIAAGWLIIAVFLLRLILKKAPRWLICAFWAIVAVRLICPVMQESTFSLIPSAETIPVRNIYSFGMGDADNSYYHQIESGIPQLNRVLRPMITKMENSNVLQAYIFLFTKVWIAGTFFLLLYALAKLGLIKRKLREAVPLCDNIWLCDAVSSPFILGTVRPRIYLPSGMDTVQMDYVLAHERAHLRRGDHWWKPLGYLLLAIYWFHPLIWMAYILLCRDIELACDEKVIKDMDLKGKKAYSEALTACSLQRQMVLVFPLAFGEVGVKQRIKTVLKYKKPAFWLTLAAMTVFVTVTACFLTDPKTVSEDDGNGGMGNPYDTEMVGITVLWHHNVLIHGEQMTCDVCDDVVRDRYICPKCGDLIVVEHKAGEKNHSVCPW